jgi:hypothetical protein
MQTNINADLAAATRYGGTTRASAGLLADGTRSVRAGGCRAAFGTLCRVLPFSNRETLGVLR